MRKIFFIIPVIIIVQGCTSAELLETHNNVMKSLDKMDSLNKKIIENTLVNGKQDENFSFKSKSRISYEDVIEKYKYDEIDYLPINKKVLDFISTQHIRWGYKNTARENNIKKIVEYNKNYSIMLKKLKIFYNSENFKLHPSDQPAIYKPSFNGIFAPNGRSYSPLIVGEHPFFHPRNVLGIRSISDIKSLRIIAGHLKKERSELVNKTNEIERKENFINKEVKRMRKELSMIINKKNSYIKTKNIKVKKAKEAKKAKEIKEAKEAKEQYEKNQRMKLKREKEEIRLRKIREKEEMKREEIREEKREEIRQRENKEPDFINGIFGKIGYIRDRKTGCKVSNSSRESVYYRVKWSGSCRSGYAHGLGNLLWYENGAFIDASRGSMTKGRFNDHMLVAYLKKDKDVIFYRYSSTGIRLEEVREKNPVFHSGISGLFQNGASGAIFKFGVATLAGAKALSSAVKGSSSSYSSSSNSDSNSYGRSCSDFVTFSFDGPGADVNAKIQMSGASSIKIKGNGSSNISARSRSLGGCIEGKYHFNYSNNTSWFGPPDNKTYRGSFSVPFSATHCEVKITQGFSAKISTSCN